VIDGWFDPFRVEIGGRISRSKDVASLQDAVRMVHPFRMLGKKVASFRDAMVPFGR
jgi:hypothetical protein